MGTNRREGFMIVQVHLTQAEVEVLDKHAKGDCRSRKTQAEFWLLTKLYASPGPFNREQGPPKPMK